MPLDIQVGDIDANGSADLIYPGKVKVCGRDKNAIKVAENTGSSLEDKGAVQYLSDEIIEAMVAQDLDNDGDTDIMYKTTRNDSTFTGLENKTRKGKDNVKFNLKLKEKISGDDDDGFGF